MMDGPAVVLILLIGGVAGWGIGYMIGRGYAPERVVYVGRPGDDPDKPIAMHKWEYPRGFNCGICGRGIRDYAVHYRLDATYRYVDERTGQEAV